MALNTIWKNANTAQRHCANLQIKLVFIVIFALCLQTAHGINRKTSEHLCGPDDGSLNKECEHGGYIVNPNRTICKDIYMCYGGPGYRCSNTEDISSTGKCSPELVCKCGICQNCVGNNCKMVLCSDQNSTFKKWIKRFERNFLEYAG